jgi:hypothetical protein
MPEIFWRDKAGLLVPSVQSICVYYMPSMSVAQAVAEARVFLCTIVEKNADIDRIFFDYGVGSTRFEGTAVMNACGTSACHEHWSGILTQAGMTDCLGD